MASGKNVRDRAKYILTKEVAKLSEIKRDHNECLVAEATNSFVAQSVRFHPSEVPVARESQEDQISTSTTTAAPRPSTAPPVRICSECGKKLSYNNVTGKCGNCEKHSVTEALEHLSEIRRTHNEHAVARESQEDQMSSTASEITPRPSTAPPARICSECGKAQLSYNNTHGICGNCRKNSSRKTNRHNGHNGAQPHRELQASPKRHAAPAKPNGNGAPVNGNGNGHGAQTAGADGSLILMPHVSNRVDMLLAQIPPGDKIKLLEAWISGAV
jgi:uncharacterized protein with PIN domain